MLTAAREDSPRQSLQGSWPLKFFEPPRSFDRESENQPYIEWVEGTFDYFEEDGEEEDDEDNDKEDNEWDNVLVEQEDEKETIDGPHEENKAEAEDRLYVEFLQAFCAYFEEVNADDEEEEEDHRHPEHIERVNGQGDENEEPSDRPSTARIFMEGLTGDKEILPYPDQVEVVVGFAEQEKLEESGTPIALLDDMISGGDMSMKSKACKSSGWALNLKELRAELSKQRFKIKCDPDDSTSDAHDEAYDLDRRIL